MWFYWFRITTIQHWLQICHGHFKLGASWNVTHYDFSYLGPLCGWAMSFLLCRVDHGNVRRVGGRRAQGDFNKLLPSHAGPSCKALESVSQAVLWLRALLSGPLGSAPSWKPCLQLHGIDQCATKGPYDMIVHRLHFTRIYLSDVLLRRPYDCTVSNIDEFF